MTDTVRTQSELLTTLFQDGQAPGSISPQDVRDLVVSVAHTADPRLSDARTPTAHTHPVAQLSDSTPTGQALVTAANAAAARTTLGLATVASSGAYTDLSGRPTLATVAASGAFADLVSRPTTLAGYGITDGLTSAAAASTYLTPSAAASTYLTQSAASSTYLTQTNAGSLYLSATGYTALQVNVGQAGGAAARRTLTAGTNVTITDTGTNVVVAASGGGASAATASALGTVKILGTPTDAANPTVFVREQTTALLAGKVDLALLARLAHHETGYVSGRYYDGGLDGSASSAVGAVVGTIYYVLFTPVESATFNQIGFAVSASVAGSVARFAVYAADATTGRPGALLTDYGEVSTATGTQFNGVTGISLALTLGVPIYLAGRASAAITVRSRVASALPSYGYAGGFDLSPGCAYSETGTYGAFPATAGTLVISNAPVPGVRLAAA